MSTKHLLSLLLLSSLLSASVFSEPEARNSHKAPEEVAVEGLVYCQNCTKKGTWSLDGAKPMPATKVGIACKDRKNRVGFYKAFQTDSNGYFFALLQGGFKSFFKGDPISACAVRLLSSPDSSCNLLTNINYGIDGSQLRWMNQTVSGASSEAALYAIAPLAFRPNNCAPETVY